MPETGTHRGRSALILLRTIKFFATQMMIHQSYCAKQHDPRRLQNCFCGITNHKSTYGTTKVMP
jgi:hypothetical protein